jgi:CRISPR-associated protein Cmr2
MKRELIGEHSQKWDGHPHLDKIVQIQLLYEGVLNKRTKTIAQNLLKKWIIGDENGRDKIGLNDLFKKQYQTYINPLCLYSTLPNISTFPSGSWAISFNFKLHKPYISQDDTNLYIIDNPVKKEWVFKLPYIAPSQWKGALRSAMVRELIEKADSLSDDEFAARRFHLTLLFGDEKGEEQSSITGLVEYLNKVRPDAVNPYEQKVRLYFSTNSEETLPHHVGRIHFYPTYFTQIGLELINPHDRKTGSGIQPIYFETVPYGAEATFTLLYVALDRIGEKIDETKKQSAYDMYLIAEGILTMMIHYGFGAKTSSGFGMVETDLDGGKLVLNAEGIDICVKDEPMLKLPDKEYHKYLNMEEGTVKEQFCGDDEEPMKGREYNRRAHDEKTPEGGGSQKEYKKFVKWYNAHGEAWSKSVQLKNNSSAELTSFEFKNFYELTDLANSYRQIVNETVESN